jgi:drug/metabolite transporter (DMT)-like permease
MTRPVNDVTGALFLVVAATLWGCWSIVFRSAEALSVAPLPASSETAVVFMTVLVAMGPLAVVARRRQRRQLATGAVGMRLPARSRRDWSLLLALGVTDAVNALCFFQAMQQTTVAIAVLCHYLTPVLVAVWSPLVLGERRRVSTLVALVVALSGLVLLLQPWVGLSAGDVAGAGLASLSAVFYAATVFIGKGLSGRFNPFEVTAWSKLTSVPVLVVAALLMSDGLAVEARPLLALVAGGVVCGALPALLFYAGLQRLQASQASVLTLVEPLVAVMVGVTVWGEPLNALGMLGGALVLLGAVIIARVGASSSSSV